MAVSSPPSPRTPVLLLKTRSHPTDAYEQYFSQQPSPGLGFEPVFVPVLEHTLNETNVAYLADLVSSGKIREEYGGVISTSQRAVEAWIEVGSRVDDGRAGKLESRESEVGTTQSHAVSTIPKTSKPPKSYDPDFTPPPMPMYVVGPATHTMLSQLLPKHPSLTNLTNPSLLGLGAHTGSATHLAPFILSHYNTLHSHLRFTYYEAPRLPFIPLLGAGGENYSRRRLDGDDARLRKKRLLFLVGEKRRDVMKRLLEDERLGEKRIEVEEVEVYRTEEARGFGEELGKVLEAQRERGVRLCVVVVFSPQGCESLLRRVGVLSDDGKGKNEMERRWKDAASGRDEEMRYVIATIGPTTRDYLSDTFGFEADVCAETPSPEGVGEGVRKFLREKGLVS